MFENLKLRIKNLELFILVLLNRFLQSLIGQNGAVMFYLGQAAEFFDNISISYFSSFNQGFTFS